MNIDIPESSMSRYRVNDPDGNYTFHLRLRDESVEAFLFKEGSYSRYGPEWERQINEDLMRIVDEIFEETHPLLGIINRIAPFLGIGLFTQQPGFPSIILPRRKEKLGVALVGLGSYAGGRLAPGLQQTVHCELRGIVTGTPSNIPVWQERYGIADKNVYNYETMHEVANNGDIDII